MLDLLQVLGDELGTISITSERLATQIKNAAEQMKKNGCKDAKIYVVAYSQGGSIANNAFQALHPDIRRLIHYAGNGAESFVGKGLGLASQVDYWNTGAHGDFDPIPLLGNFLNPAHALYNVMTGGYDWKEGPGSNHSPWRYSYGANYKP